MIGAASRAPRPIGRSVAVAVPLAPVVNTGSSLHQRARLPQRSCERNGVGG